MRRHRNTNNMDEKEVNAQGGKDRTQETPYDNAETSPTTRMVNEDPKGNDAAAPVPGQSQNPNAQQQQQHQEENIKGTGNQNAQKPQNLNGFSGPHKGFGGPDHGQQEQQQQGYGPNSQQQPQGQQQTQGYQPSSPQQQRYGPNNPQQQGYGPNNRQGGGGQQRQGGQGQGEQQVNQAPLYRCKYNENVGIKRELDMETIRKEVEARDHFYAPCRGSEGVCGGRGFHGVIPYKRGDLGLGNQPSTPTSPSGANRYEPKSKQQSPQQNEEQQQQPNDGNRSPNSPQQQDQPPQSPFASQPVTDGCESTQNCEPMDGNICVCSCPESKMIRCAGPQHDLECGLRERPQRWTIKNPSLYRCDYFGNAVDRSEVNEEIERKGNQYMANPNQANGKNLNAAAQYNDPQNRGINLNMKGVLTTGGPNGEFNTFDTGEKQPDFYPLANGRDMCNCHLLRDDDRLKTRLPRNYSASMHDRKTNDRKVPVDYTAVLIKDDYKIPPGECTAFHCKQ